MNSSFGNLGIEILVEYENIDTFRTQSDNNDIFNSLQRKVSAISKTLGDVPIFVRNLRVGQQELR